ncbi:MAG: DUF4159 domain-containing protein [Planctomycetes bacterium]|nr:DUF4159 domain-containing protein [Planctomycetota bacterium]
MPARARRRRPGSRSDACTACLLVALGLAPARGIEGRIAAAEPAAQVAAADIQRAVDRARDYLIGQQKTAGYWEALGAPNKRPGATALVMLALANAGVEPDRPVMKRGLEWLRKQEPQDTYAVSLQTMALAMLSPMEDRAILERNVDWLEAAQVKRGPGAGSWSYTLERNEAVGDNSNSQFALLGLHEASRAGVGVRQDTWVRAQQYWVACGNADGSWGYTLGNAAGTGSMTCAGIASVWITAEHLGRPDAAAGRDGVLCCGGGAAPKTVEKGLAWLGRRFTVTQNPGTGGDTWLFYYLYGLERVGRFTARRFIGEHEWYREGATMFVGLQDRLTGKFVANRIEDATVATSFALLFLAKGRRPVLVAKSRHEFGDDWNRHGHDVAHLVEHVEGRWRKEYPAGLSWHVTDTPTARLDDLQQAPVLWISGRDAFELGPDAGQRLRLYIDNGGFIFAEACCPKSGEFDRRFRQLIGEIFPEPEHALGLLPPEHPAWNAEEVVPPDLHRPLLGVDYGCRTCVIYAPPTDAGPDAPGTPSLSCLWELGGRSAGDQPEPVAREVRAALAIGTNVLAYATNRELQNKDELFGLMPDVAADRDRFDRGRLGIGKLRHAGMCDAAPAALANVLRAAARETGIRVDDAPALVDPADEALFDYHLLFMHGRQRFAYDDPRRSRIATFLDRGGMIFADSVCASPDFAAAFREEIAVILPGRPLEPVPADDPLFTAAAYGGYDIRQVDLREPAGDDGQLRARTRRIAPKLEGIRIGDRWAVIFSPYDLSCALEKHNSMECTGYGREDAEKIALNVLLYSLNH